MSWVEAGGAVPGTARCAAQTVCDEHAVGWAGEDCLTEDRIVTEYGSVAAARWPL